jgi:hypothetical protein
MKFAPRVGAPACEYCGHEEPQPENAAAASHALEKLKEQESGPVAQEGEVSCPKCGAAYSLPALRQASCCPYCDTPALRDPLNPVTPDGVLPFRIDEKEGHDLFARWIGSLWFAPSELSRVVDARKRLQGYYIPHWLFDADTDSIYEGERGDAYYETVDQRIMTEGKEKSIRKEVRKIRWTPVSGRVARRFEDLPVCAEGRLPRRLIASLAPWPTADAFEKDERLWCGFEVQEYAIGLAQAHDEAREVMHRHIRYDVRRDIGGDEQRIHSIDTRWSDERARELLLPIWTTRFRYKGKEYHYVINGVTGVVKGERPYSYWKIAGLVAAIVLIVAVAAYWDQIRAALGF